MNALSATFAEFIGKYWYVAAAGAILVVAVLVTLVTVLSRGAGRIRQNAAIKRALKRESEEENRRAEEKRARMAEDARFYETAISEEETPDGENGSNITEIKTTEDDALKTDEKPANTAKKAVYRVVYDGENKEWMIKKDGAARVIRRVKTKAEALEIAGRLADNQDLSLTVQKKDGKFQKKRNYSNITR
ncbi:MAG: DUF2188 domain-containing protein [Clostridia bacterium]|nr:DUF2188 domain-containing protein [Clostridia bacterium]